MRSNKLNSRQETSKKLLLSARMFQLKSRPVPPKTQWWVDYVSSDLVVALGWPLWEWVPHISLSREHSGDLVEDGGGEQETKSIGLEDPALVDVVLQREGLDHGTKSVGVDHSAAHYRFSLRSRQWSSSISESSTSETNDLTPIMFSTEHKFLVSTI